MAGRPETSDGESEGTEEASDLFRAVGRQIKTARERAGLSQKELGQRVGYGEEQISSVERGRRTPQPEFLTAVDDLLGCGGLLAVTAEDVERAKSRRRVRHPEWFRDYARLEAEAVELHYYAALALPGLLQTQGHAQAVFTSRRPLLDEETIEQRVAARLARQGILTGWPPPLVTFTIEESVLQRPTGGSRVQGEQMQRLRQVASLRNVELQIMPTDREDHPSLGGPFTLLTPKGKPQVGYVEVQNVSRLVTDPEEVRMLAARYGSIRAQALTPNESLALIEKLLGDQ
ncbi:transcriptional regulator with XRE-family HTH domain [Streptomyces sp. V3I8]|uniref:helix-turn-helix domain-containing protein n=1 Tax=Streptomyces sp. V3I8 TaxID=3042279 RepID=UPI00278B5CF9|nr:helix-turn-helix transcriptional regulator [Streptomyces sp. V3I8]MDQ1035039.1 transcriptional regulator with XRE-family HTH domain [Streptomyces sp. V3I8]